jgi:hypothetical protein
MTGSWSCGLQVGLEFFRCEIAHSYLMFVPLISTMIHLDCPHRPCLELWEVSVLGVRDERTLRHLFGHSLTYCLKH